jgi:RNA polymerase sigma-70 factor (ECF subfamily)
MLGNRTEAEDVVQETFLRAFVAIERRGFAVHTSLRAWLGRIAVNLCYDRLRRKSWHDLPLEPAGAGAGAGPVPAETAGLAAWHDASPEQAALRGDLTDDLRRAMAALPPNHRAAILLRYAYDLSYREIATVLDVPENTVATWLRRAHLAMRRHLTEEEAKPCRVTARA